MAEKLYELETIVMEDIELSLPKRVGILGGTFNPPHIGHLVIADQALEQLNLDLVLFMPSGIPPHKEGKEAISAAHRVEMTILATQDHPSFQIELYEATDEQKHYTFDTMTYLMDRYPETQFYFIIGGDMVADLPNWYKIEELVKMVEFVAFHRSGYPVESEYPLIFLDAPMMDISSTDIRQMVSEGRSIKYLVSDDVRHYIEEERLYLNDGNGISEELPPYNA